MKKIIFVYIVLFSSILCADEAKEEIKLLAKNVRLEINSLPLDNEDKLNYIVTAAENYKTLIKFKNDNVEIEFAVEGLVKIRDDGKLFVSYTVNILYDGPEGHAEYIFKGGVLVKSGKAIAISNIDKKTLTIKATILE